MFDCWLPGFLYVRHIAERDDVDLIFVHNSESQTGQPAKEYKDFKANLQVPGWVSDFSQFGGDFNRMFDELKPDILLVTSMHYVECRSALMFAGARGAKTAFIPHGIFLLDRDKTPTAPSSGKSRLFALFTKIPRVFYYTRLFWRAHFQRYGHKKLGPALACYKSLMTRYSRWQWSADPAAQTYYAGLLDLAIIYDPSVRDHYLEHSPKIFSRTRFVLAGTLDTGKILAEARKTPTAEIMDKPADEAGEKVAYYISSPYPENFNDAGAEILADLMGRLKLVAEAGGCDRLVYRPHPGEPSWFVDRVCAKAGIERDAMPGLGGLLAADLVCSTSSSLLYVAIKLGKPILVLRSGRFKADEPYFEPLISHPKIGFDGDADPQAEAARHGDELRRLLREAPRPDLGSLLDPADALLEAAERG
ncbi:hypothetical protein BV394_16140 (plasmid) [Brevirhabdus pacifica]|uniref:Uncharacterized protein n=1 Tax=Brevirhabdus pacifica TaxID=1267768 RepID=A0A1P8QYE1_9RHOB|nr:hypothetical protein BV394_16140 [Brevirhabdus pacifica]